MKRRTPRVAGLRDPRRPPPRSQRPLYRSPLMWIGSIVTAVVSAVVTALVVQGVGLAPRFEAPGADPTQLRPGPPVRVDSVTLEHSRQAIGGTFVFAEPFVPSDSELAELNGEQNGGDDTQWFRSRGAVDPEIGDATLVLQGNSSQEVRITDMKVRKNCTRPLDGTLFWSPPAGAEDNTLLEFDLDQDNPRAQERRGRDELGDFFSRKSISLKPNEQITLQIRATTLKHYCRFSFDATVVDVNGPKIVPIRNHDRDFEVTALSIDEDNGQPPLRPYRVAYVGGVESLDHNDNKFSRVDPQTFVPQY